MTFDQLLILVVGILMLVWLVGLLKRIGGCLIHLALLAAGALLIYAIYTGSITLPL